MKLVAGLAIMQGGQFLAALRARVETRGLDLDIVHAQRLLQFFARDRR